MFLNLFFLDKTFFYRFLTSEFYVPILRYLSVFVFYHFDAISYFLSMVALQYIIIVKDWEIIRSLSI